MENGVLKAFLAVVCALASSAVTAGKDDYYECTNRDGSLEYSLYACEVGQEQRHIGNKELFGSHGRKKKREGTPTAAQSEQRQGEESKTRMEYKLATYKCVGKSGDILYTDAKDYLAFATYRCKQITLSSACDEARVLKAKDPLAVVSNKLSCP